MLLILIGLRASGKSTIGPALAASLNCPFTDLDHITAKTLSAATASDAWRVHGEPAFRKAEVDALKSVLAKGAQVLALGGGTPTAPGALPLLKAAQASAEIIYLRASPQTLSARLAANPSDRPSLTGADPIAEVDAVFAKRDPNYIQLADIVINVDGHSEEETARQMITAINAD